jgi:hypothetical protein
MTTKIEITAKVHTRIVEEHSPDTEFAETKEVILEAGQIYIAYIHEGYRINRIEEIVQNPMEA